MRAAVVGPIPSEIYEDPSFPRDDEPRVIELGPGAFVLVFVRRTSATE